MSSFPIPDQEGASPEEGHGFWSLHSGAGWGQHPESWRLLWVGQEEGGVRADSLPLPKPRKEGRGHTSLSEGLPFPLLCPSALETRSPDPKKIRPFSSVALSTFIINFVSLPSHRTRAGPDFVPLSYHEADSVSRCLFYLEGNQIPGFGRAQGYVCEACFVSNALWPGGV